MTKNQDSAIFKFDGRASSGSAGTGQFGFALADFVMGRSSSFSTTGTNLIDPWGTSRTIKYTRAPTPFDPNPNTFAYPARISGVSAYSANFPTPYVLQWNTSVERALTKNITVQAAYVGNRGLKLLQNIPTNLPVWNDGAASSNLATRRPLAGYSEIRLIEPRARSWYNSLQLSSNVRLTRRLTARLSYVYGDARDNSSEALWGDPRGGDAIGGISNPYNLDAEKAPTLARHNFRAYYVLELPRLASAHQLLKQTLGGWQISGALTISSGDPLDVLLGQDWNYDGVSGDRPNLNAPITYASGSKDQRANQFFDTSVFSTPGTHNAFGNLSRNAIWGPGSWNTDLAVAKNWRVWGERSIQARAEAFDALNHNNLDAPVTTVNSSNFGRVLTRTGQRTVQVALKFAY